VAGPGVSQSLLGSVYGRGSVTRSLMRHPLYLFDQGRARSRRGLGRTFPAPWHGLWWLVEPVSAPLALADMLTTTTSAARRPGRHHVDRHRWEEFPVYSYTLDTATTSKCTGACAIGGLPC